MAWWRLGSVLMLAFATASSYHSQSALHFSEDKGVSGKWVDLHELRSSALGRRQELDDYDEDHDYSSGIAQVGEVITNKNRFQGPGVNPRAGQTVKCPFTPSPLETSTMLPTIAVPQAPSGMASSLGAQNCAVREDQRVACGSSESPSDCEQTGCCFDSDSSTCYYPMDECTKDQHFVFAIHRDSPTRNSVDPRKLVIPADRSCKPVIANSRFAIFKFSIHDCGTHFYKVGGTNIYLAEVQTVVSTLSLKYGIITRTNHLRFAIECRYDADGSVSQSSIVSVGFMVKTPLSDVPSQIVSDGLFAIQLRIATDETFTNYMKDDHLPLRLLLGSPVYLEVRLRSPQPKAVLLVNYCLAYPRSASNALVIIYEGCANPFDPDVAILRVADSTNRHTRRFMVDAFQFMDLKTNKYLDEDIYFMCSTELCLPVERQCEQQCFDGRRPGLQELP